MLRATRCTCEHVQPAEMQLLPRPPFEPLSVTHIPEFRVLGTGIPLLLQLIKLAIFAEPETDTVRQGELPTIETTAWFSKPRYYRVPSKLPRSLGIGIESIIVESRRT